MLKKLTCFKCNGCLRENFQIKSQDAVDTCTLHTEVFIIVWYWAFCLFSAFVSYTDITWYRSTVQNWKLNLFIYLFFTKFSYIFSQIYTWCSWLVTFCLLIPISINRFIYFFNALFYLCWIALKFKLSLYALPVPEIMT